MDFHQQLQSICDMINQYRTNMEYKILIIGHICFFNCWYYGEKNDLLPDKTHIMKIRTDKHGLSVFLERPVIFRIIFGDL